MRKITEIPKMTMTKKQFQKTIAGTPFEKHCMVDIDVNGQPMSKALWNLMLTKRDVQMFCRGIKPHRFWKLRDVKYYFGVSGQKEKVASQIIAMYDFITAEAEKVAEAKIKEDGTNN